MAGLPLTRKATMKDVAAAAGVSTATVSRALKGDPAISLATRLAVADVAQRVQYRPSAAARRLRTKSKKTQAGNRENCRTDIQRGDYRHCHHDVRQHVAYKHR